ncbi:MAG: hypothetical protein ACREI3_03435 [Nitrospirales bacterium]
MPSPEPGRLAGYLRTVIEALPLPPPRYCVIGALAVNAWGRIRTTQDIDLLVLSQESVRAAVTGSLISHGFQPDETWIEHNPMAKDRLLRLGHPSSPGIPLDVLFSADSQEESALSRARPVKLLDVSVSICSPEDLILMKLKASRPHDFEDALGIVKNPHLQLDRAYLWGWADRLGLQGELHYVLHAAEPRG